jgi:hypothetical protein
MAPKRPKNRRARKGKARRSTRKKPANKKGERKPRKRPESTVAVSKSDDAPFPVVFTASPSNKRAAERQLRALVASYLDYIDPASLGFTDVLGQGGYGFSTYRLEALARPMTNISREYGGKAITVVAAGRARTFGDLIKLLMDALF